jgi:hypothetical protein
MACCTKGLSPVYISRARIQTMLMLIVTNGGCGGFSDQFVRIPLFT